MYILDHDLHTFHSPKYSRCFVSGRGRMVRKTTIAVPQGADGRFPPSATAPRGLVQFQCYGLTSSRYLGHLPFDDSPAIPVHSLCYRILCEAWPSCFSHLAVRNDSVCRSIIDMSTEDLNPNLSVNYGPPEPITSPAWRSYVESEILVFNPLSFNLFGEVMSVLDRCAEAPVPTPSPAGSDIPLSNLPEEICAAIAEFLDTPELFAFSQVSWVLNNRLRNNKSLWLKRLREYSRWFHEVDDAMESKNYTRTSELN